MKITPTFEELLRKAHSQPDLKPDADLVRSASAVLYPIARPYQRMLSEGVIPLEVIKSKVNEHVAAIDACAAAPSVKIEPIHQLQEFLRHLDESLWMGHASGAQTTIYHKAGQFSGTIRDKHFPAMSETQLHSHLVKSGFHPTLAERLINGAKASGFEKDRGSRAAEHAARAHHHLKTALANPGDRHSTTHLGAAADHLDKARDVAAHEHKTQGFTHPSIKAHVRALGKTFSKFKAASVHEQKTSAHELEHNATVQKFVKRFNAKPPGEAKPHEYLHVDGKDASWILGKHQPGKGRKPIWWLSKHEKLR